MFIIPEQCRRCDTKWASTSACKICRMEHAALEKAKRLLAQAAEEAAIDRLAAAIVKRWLRNMR